MKFLNFEISKSLFVTIFTAVLLCPFGVSASFSVSPLIVDESGVPRDSVSSTITLTNSSENRRLRIFTFVNNVSETEEGGIEEFEIKRGLDVAESLANWISITRQQIEIGPGESKEIPITVNIHRDAKPGKYHAMVFFADGSRRSEAEGSISKERSVTIVLEVKDDSEDILNLSGFFTDNRIVTDPSVGFSVVLNNNGDTTLVPKGEVSLYDRTGKELGSVPFNEDGLKIEPGEEKDFKVLWNDGLDWGKQRARLTASYGSAGRRYTFDDTIFFTFVPVFHLVLIFLSLLIVVITLTHFIHERLKKKSSLLHKKHHRFSDDHEQDENTINLRKW